MKSSDDLKRERELLSELLELVQKRSFIVDSLEEERVRYLFMCPHFILARRQPDCQAASHAALILIMIFKLMSEMKPWLMRATEIQI